MIDAGLTLYLKEMQSHISSYEIQLDELHHDLVANNFKQRDYRATERLLQLLTEACIGLAKHWSKKINKIASVDAYQSFKLLTEHKKITTADLLTWRKIIGMRNSLVHDYLNIDLLIIENILRNKQYQTLKKFALLANSALQKD